MFDDRDLAELRQMSRDAMDCTAQILRPAAPPQYGQPPEEPTVIAEFVPCRVVSNGSGTEREAGGVSASIAPFIVQLDGVQDVRGSDVITVIFGTAPEDITVMEYAVVGVESPISYQVNTRVFVTFAT